MSEAAPETLWETLWEIEPIDGYQSGRKIEDIASVQYGVPPAGYRQCYPPKAAAPNVLVKGNKYEYWFDTAHAPHARNCFIIRGSRAVEVVD